MGSPASSADGRLYRPPAHLGLGDECGRHLPDGPGLEIPQNGAVLNLALSIFRRRDPFRCRDNFTEQLGLNSVSDRPVPFLRGSKPSAVYITKSVQEPFLPDEFDFDKQEVMAAEENGDFWPLYGLHVYFRLSYG